MKVTEAEQAHEPESRKNSQLEQGSDEKPCHHDRGRDARQEEHRRHIRQKQQRDPELPMNRHLKNMLGKTQHRLHGHLVPPR